MEPTLAIILVFFVGVLASFIGAMVGGAGLLSIPLLIFLGLPPQMAVATNKFGGIGLSLGAVTKFWHAKKIDWRYMFPLCALGLAGAYLGSTLLLRIPQSLLSKMVGVLLLLMLPLLLIRQDMGVRKHIPTTLQRMTGYGVYFITMVYGAFFGAGSGTLLTYLLVFFFGLPMVEAMATQFIPWLLLSALSLLIYAAHGIVSYTYGIALFLGMLVGGYAGAHVAIKKGNAWVKLLFAIVVVALAVKLLFF